MAAAASLRGSDFLAPTGFDGVTPPGTDGAAAVPEVAAAWPVFPCVV